MKNKKNRLHTFLPLMFAAVLVTGIYMGSRMGGITGKVFHAESRRGQFNKLSELLNYIENEYVDTISEKMLMDHTIESLLGNLDPHSAYIPAEELQAMNEPLEGNFEGIGVEFHIQNDTIMVVTPVSGGPSEALGIQSGDKIVRIEGKNVAGIGITNNEVMQKLRGPGGTKVKISIRRMGTPRLIEYTIVRGKIPIYSVDVAYMAKPGIGYVKISRFASNTYDEFMQAYGKLRKQGMKKLIIDLRGNPGGYLNAATDLADEFLDDRKIIVYTEGKARPRETYVAEKKGAFEKGELAVLIDEGSASASEILAGALQDWDRAWVVGRRSFGKGLVQEQTVFPDGSAVRLTIARYYTPTGRSIQKSYKDGIEAYNSELSERMSSGELENADSVRFSDTLKYKTPGGRIVYGGGGIMPDVFVPLDTTGSSSYLNGLFRKGVLSSFVYDYANRNRMNLSQYKSFDTFIQHVDVNDGMLRELIAYGERSGIPFEASGYARSADIIRTQLKALLARQFFKNEGFYPVINGSDKAFMKALKMLQEGKMIAQKPRKQS